MAGMKLGFDPVSFLVGMLGLEKAWGAGDASVPPNVRKTCPIGRGLDLVMSFGRRCMGLCGMISEM